MLIARADNRTAAHIFTHSGHDHSLYTTGCYYYGTLEALSRQFPQSPPDNVLRTYSLRYAALYT